MADLERSVYDFYQIQTAFPGEWPSEKNEDASDDSDGGDKEAQQRKAKLNRRKSRYQALERAATHRSSHVPGSEKTGNIVQRDEPDPLGTTDSVMIALKRQGLGAVQDDPKLRNRFLLSSTSFQPALFLSQVHTDASTETLLGGMDVLSQSIDQKSASLKVLVESNFERFVRAKATIDNVYKEMKYHGTDPTPPRARTHSRHASRNSFRSSTGGGAGAGASGALGSLGNPAASPMDGVNRKRNALLKESEYGVMGIKAPLLEVSAKAEDVWGPALGGRDKEEMLRMVSTELDRFHEYVEASASITESIKRNDHETLVEEYHRARRFADDARATAQQLTTSGQTPTDAQMHQILLAARMWHDVDEQIQAYKRDVWRKLTSMHNVTRSTGGGGGGGPSGLAHPGHQQPRDQHMELISLLLELGVDDNPIWVWLLSRYDYLKGKIQATCDRTKVEIEVLRRRLANNGDISSTSNSNGGGKGTGDNVSGVNKAPGAIATHLRLLGRPAMENKISLLDAPDVIELWEKVHGFVAALLSAQGILGEVIEFWQTVEGFVAGKTQRSLPTGYNGESQTHHRLSQQGAVDLQKGAVELVDIIREQVYSFFVGPPPEDISLLFSPVPPSPKTPRTPMSALGNGAYSPSTFRDPRFNIDPKNPPPPSPRRGDAWESFGFWPPYSNSISGVHYLSKLLALVGSGASEMATITTDSVPNEIEPLRTLVAAVRERCVTALCAAWNRDAENVKYVEDWHRAPDRRDVTKMPATFAAFESAILAGMQKIMYVSEAMAKPGAGDIVLPPPTKLLQMVRGQYVTTLYKALSGMVENAERPVKRADDDWTTAALDGGAGGGGGDAGFVVVSTAAGLGDGRAPVLLDSGAFNSGDRNVRMLLTLSNLQALRSEVVPKLNTQFENAFSVKLTDETKTIRDVLGQIDTRLFLSYTRPSVESLRRIVRGGVLGPSSAVSTSGAGGKPKEARPYVYEALLLLVLVHSEVSTTTASGGQGASSGAAAGSTASSTPSLTQQVLSHLLEQTSRELLEALKASTPSRHFDLTALMQATLDVEFIAQTLSQYTTERASELQGQIYQELDARTDNDARARLQSELPEMRSVLKRLREASKNEFMCFRKPKRAGAGGGGGERGERNGSQGGSQGGGSQGGSISSV